MKNAEMKVIKFDSNDVIATSSFTLGNVFDGQTHNAYIKIGNNTYTNTAGTGTYGENADLIAAFNNAFGENAYGSLKLGDNSLNCGGGALVNVLYYDAGNSNDAPSSGSTTTQMLNEYYNGTWKFSNGKFVKQ